MMKSYIVLFIAIFNSVISKSKDFSNEEAVLLVPTLSIDKALEKSRQHDLAVVLLCIKSNEMCYDAYFNMIDTSKYFKENTSKLNITFAVVDVNAEKNVAESFGINRIPYIIILTQDRFYPYLGKYDSENLIDYLQKWEIPNYEEYIIRANSSNIIETLKNAKDGSLVMFHHGLVPVSNLGLQHYLAAAKQTFIDNKQKFYFVDATNDPDIFDKIDFSSFPKFGRIVNSTIYFLSQSLGKSPCGKDLVEEANQYGNAGINTIDDPQEFNAYLMNLLNQQFSFAVYYIRNTGSLNFMNYKILKSSFWKEFNIIYTQNKDIAKDNGCSIEKDCLLVFFPEELSHMDYDVNKTIKLENDLKLNDFKQILFDNIRPLVGFFTPSGLLSLAYKQYSIRDKPLIIVVYDVDFEPEVLKETKYIWNKIVSVAKDYKDTYIFAIAERTTAEKSYLSNYFDKDDLSDIKIILKTHDDYGLTYVMEDSFSKENLKKFIEDKINNKIAPKLRSKPDPGKNYFHSVKVVVGDTFKTVVLENEKYSAIALLIFSFSETTTAHAFNEFNKLAEVQNKKKGNNSILFAMIDIDYNDFEIPLKIRQDTPKIILFVKSYDSDAQFQRENKKYFIYKGDYSSDSIKIFINNTTNKLHDNTNTQYKESQNKEIIGNSEIKSELKTKDDLKISQLNQSAKSEYSKNEL